LYLGGIAVIPLPALWLFSGSFTYLIGVQLFAGVSWAAYELAMFLLFFEAIPAADRTSLLTTYNLANATATVGGSLLGGTVLSALGEHHSAYLWVFTLSGLARAATLPFLLRVRHVMVRQRAPATRSIAVRPSGDMVTQPVLATLGGHAHTPVDRGDAAQPAPFERRAA
jgi:MFS family permease